MDVNFHLHARGALETVMEEMVKSMVFTITLHHLTDAERKKKH